MGRLLQEIAASHAQIAHEVLDARIQSRDLIYLRKVLVNTEVLPVRSEDIEGTPAWLEEVLTRLPARHTAIIRPYAVWSVLRRARSRARHRPATRGVRKHIRARILLVSRFLAWLENGTTTHRRLRDFLNWARARGITSNPLTIPLPVSDEAPAEVLDDDQLWQLLNRCLQDTDLALPVRAAGALLPLYALGPSKIVKLTAGDITTKDGNTYLTFDTQPVLLPPRLANLLSHLGESAPAGRRPVIERAGNSRHLLFPGSDPGRPMDPDRLSRQLKLSLGLQARPARNAALCALAADLPAPVLADLLGLHITTAVKWVRLVRRDWTDFVAARKQGNVESKRQ